MGIFDAIGGLFGAGGAHASAKALQEDAQQFQTSFYKQRYQRQMEDMRAAGLNPILSYRTGVPGTASGGIASAGGIAGAISGGITAGAARSQAKSAKGLRGSQRGLITQQLLTEQSKQQANSAAATSSIANARLTNAEAAIRMTGLDKARSKQDFYQSPAGKAAVYTQEAAGTARKVRSVFFGGR